MPNLGSFLQVLLLTASVATGASCRPNSQLPIVDLGYNIQQASSFNASGKYYNFSNIAYAEPPLGDLRFAAPVSPHTNRSSIKNGNFQVTCTQAIPFWFAEGLFGAPDLPPNPAQSEDCLFLDVFVPQQVFDGPKGKGKGAAVLVWIHGGGLLLGSKTGNDPAGLIAKAQAKAQRDGMIIVMLNYRLGAFGWLGGPDFTKQHGTDNAGLLDQRLALEWVQEHITKFGGDPERVTVIGESAGAASIVHHLTAYGGDECEAPPFQQAVIQSPAWTVAPTAGFKDAEFKNLLKTANVTSLQQLRALDSATLIKINNEIVHSGATGTFPFGGSIFVDGTYVTAPPAQLLLNGKFDKKVKAVIGINSDEGLVFTPQNETTAKDFNFKSYVKANIPTITDSALKFVTETLYPPPGPKTPYSNDNARAILFTGELVVYCHETVLSTAMHNQTHVYEFSVPPGVHVEDVAFTFFNGPNPQVASPAVAETMQGFISEFALTGNPNGKGLPEFPVYGHVNVLNLTLSGYPLVKDPHSNERCAYLQQALFG
ncbi:acetylcholinesterase precursor [Rhizodiscina lignyota]|uniref:Carboxylic ester hydrolase n=1 Tax=Rhizodiscina lignyota TaxID=1504668 RepID=A0A9P4I5L5_9PEZI|nr:acetylcholinesterase precursor [Rhizodiscina lignyota]